jgi:glycosyltransferase involved in cell wall biosynthesis
MGASGGETEPVQLRTAMRILFVTIPGSIHTARWLSLLESTGWDIHLFPSRVGPLHDDLGFVTAHGARPHGPVRRATRFLSATARLAAQELGHGERALGRILAPPDASDLARLIERLQPDVVHSMEERGWNLTLRARAIVRGPFPKWIAGDWGHEVHLFGRLSKTRESIRQVLAQCDAFQSECARNYTLARGLGFSGLELPVVPTCGGFDPEVVSALRSRHRPSVRRLVMVKGYQSGTLAGRALFAIKALEKCAGALRSYRVIVYSARDDIDIACELVRDTTGLDVRTVPPMPASRMLDHFARARASISLGLSDGISTVALEALATGAFPIQSSTSCVDEWITSGVNGAIVDAHDVDDIAAALERALTDDDLVDSALELNARIACDRLDRRQIERTVIGAYESVVASSLSGA